MPTGLPGDLTIDTCEPRPDTTAALQAGRESRVPVDAQFVEDAAAFLGVTIRSGGAGLLVTEPDTFIAVRRLLMRGGGVGASQVIFADVELLLGTILADGLPDELDFLNATDALIRHASGAGNGKVRIVSQMSALAAEIGNPAVAYEVLRLWGSLAQRHPQCEFLRTVMLDSETEG